MQTLQIQVGIKSDIAPKHQLNQFAGKVKSFAGLEAIALQREIRAEWDKTRLPN